ncbi:MAG: aminotransferase class V-fold PLP-dependent enzyme [Curvibacter sp.]|nr:MAG: aminotransferase class V-fold PLP-dependent enzyme [Curvibacter sp.]
MHTPLTEIYLDCNATTPLLPAARVAALRAMEEQFGNPSSSHCAGLRARALVDGVRARASRLLGVGDGRLLLVSGATEGIQTAVLSALCALRDRRDAGEHVEGPLLVGATEHKAVPQSLAHWNAVLGLRLPIVEVPVDRNGLHDMAFLQAHIAQAGLLCTMAANNETGVVSDIRGIESLLQSSGSRALWLVDCVQALGKLDLNLQTTRIDYAPFSGHKLYAPKGIGMLYVRASSPFTPLMVGGGQEDGQRSGTENMPGIAALGAVLEALEAGHVGEGAVFRPDAYLQQARMRLAHALQSAFPGLVFNMPFAGSLPTTLNFSVPGQTSKALLNLFDAAGMRISAGSACSAAKAEPSFVLCAMGVPAWQAEGAARLSIGALCDDDLIDEACARIARCGVALQSTTASIGQSMPIPAVTSVHAIPEDWGVLTAATLPAFLLHHPDALLVDVREPYEHAVGLPSMPWAQQALQNVPLAGVAQHVPGWLEQGQRPLVFFCRSGGRSAQAVQALRAQGHDQAWHLAGGLAQATFS